MTRRPHLASAALAVGLVLAGCGGATHRSGPPSSGSSASGSIRLGLAGATQRLTACGSNKPFVVSHLGQPLLATGAVLSGPNTAQRVKLKLKHCEAGMWRVAGEQHVRLGPNGRFQTIVSVQAPGDYTVRAYYYVGARTVRSTKAYAHVEP